MSDDSNNITAYVSPELDYHYRDIANIYVGVSDVTIEFGNHHKATPGNAVISNRIVMSVSNAYDLHKRLEQSLIEAQQAILQQSNNG